MAAEAELIVRLIEAADGGGEFGVVVHVEARLGEDVEHPVGAIAVLGVVAAAENLNIVDILRVDVGSETRRDVRIGDGNAIDEPRSLVAAAHVKHVVGQVGGGGEIDDHREAVGQIGAGRALNLLAIDQRGRRKRLLRGCADLGSHHCRLADGRNGKLHVKHLGSIRGQRKALLQFGKRGRLCGDRIVAKSNGRESEFAFGIRLRFLGPRGSG